MKNSSKIFDGLLVLEYRAGSKKAFGILVEKYHLKLCRHANYYTKDTDVAKDIVQDSWSVIWRKLPLLKDPNAFGSWAFRIVTRRALNYVNKHKNSAIPLGEKEPKFMEVESTEEQHLQHNRLKSAISKLSEDQQMVLRLFYIEAYSLREISEILDISVGTVKSRLFHSREKLKNILKQK